MGMVHIVPGDYRCTLWAQTDCHLWDYVMDKHSCLKKYQSLILSGLNKNTRVLVSRPTLRKLLAWPECTIWKLNWPCTRHLPFQKFVCPLVEPCNCHVELLLPVIQQTSGTYRAISINMSSKLDPNLSSFDVAILLIKHIQINNVYNECVSSCRMVSWSIKTWYLASRSWYQARNFLNLQSPTGLWYKV